jgi:uncharacterized RDD family membrane protein YckC
MSDREPALLGLDGSVEGAFAPRRPASLPPPASVVPGPAVHAARGQPLTVYVHGFWRRAVAGAIDLAIVLPIAALLGWLASAVSGVSLPAMKIGLFDIDLWLDLVLAMDPGLVLAMVLTWAIGLTYLAVFHIARGQTLGMRVMKMKIIDAYGESPAPRRCLVRLLGYVVSVATLGLGFLWIGFDSEKRGLHDWIAGTYVVRA